MCFLRKWQKIGSLLGFKFIYIYLVWPDSRFTCPFSGSFDEYGDFLSSELVLPGDDLDYEILFEVLRCISNISHQLGKAAAAVFYESLVSPQIISSEDVISRFIKILETGYSSLVTTSNRMQFGTDPTWEKELADHRNQRKFSVDMLLSLCSLCNKATSWSRVFDVVEKYLKYLVPRKCMLSSDSNEHFSIGTQLLVQATSQVARVMVESAFDILVLLGYLVNISGQVCLSVIGNISCACLDIHLLPC